MKNKILVSAIAMALTTFCGGLYAAGNTVTLDQTGSQGSVTTKQGETTATSASLITIIQKDSDATSSILIEQDGAVEAIADVKQYKGAASSIVIKQSGGLATTGNSVNVIQGVDGVDATNVGNTLTIDTQAGTSNKVADYSVLNDGSQTGYALQKGSTNTATLNQHGTGNMLGFLQDGTGNTTTISQDAGTATSNMNVSQVGDGNKVTTSQVGVTSSSININVAGNDNNLGDAGHKVDQLSSGSLIIVDVDGDNNLANISQTVNSDGSAMTLTQDGNSNDADMVQGGLSNTMTLTQNSDSNTAVLTQNGGSDIMTVTQNGGSSATLTQY